MAWETPQIADAWRQMRPVHARALGDATERMLDLAQLKPGVQVLDVAAGTGDQTLLAARRVGPSGGVMAIDLSPTMLEVARETLRETA